VVVQDEVGCRERYHLKHGLQQVVQLQESFEESEIANLVASEARVQSERESWLELLPKDLLVAKLSQFLVVAELALIKVLV